MANILNLSAKCWCMALHNKIMSFSNDISETTFSKILLGFFIFSTPIRIYRPKADTNKSSNKSNRSGCQLLNKTLMKNSIKMLYGA